MVKNTRLSALQICVLVCAGLLIGITVTGVWSFSASGAYEAQNQYGQGIKMFGSGIYAHDSFFKAPIFIGTDLTMLLLVVPMLIAAVIKDLKTSTVNTKISIFSVLGVVVYYAASISLGVTYNYLHLGYMALLSLSLFTSMYLLLYLHGAGLNAGGSAGIGAGVKPSRGLQAFLLCSGISLFVAWLPDIILSWVTGSSLELIEVYTTEITYILDMGIISPLIFVTWYLLRRSRFLGTVLLRMILRTCEIIGVMLPVQTVFQLAAGIEIPWPALLTKVLIFVLLAGFALYFDLSAQRYQAKLGGLRQQILW